MTPPLLARLIDRLPALLLSAGIAVPVALVPDPAAALPEAAPALALLLLYMAAGAAARRRGPAARGTPGSPG